MSEEEISSLKMTDYEKYEKDRMEKNAWLVAQDLSNCLDGSVLSTYIHG